MPRGKKGKAHRKHKRACDSGNSSKGAASASLTQMNGKKYSKGETSSYCSLDIADVVYNGTEYEITYQASNTVLEIHGISKKIKVGSLSEIMNNKITDMELKKQIIQKFINESLVTCD